MTVEVSTGIVGNTKKAEKDATEERQRQEQRKLILHRLVIGGLTAGITTVLWFGVEWSFFYRLLAASFLLLAARQTQKLADNAGLKGRPQWAPEILRAAGYTTLVVALLWSGIGTLTGKTVDFVDRCSGGDCTWTKDAPAETADELMSRTPQIQSNDLSVPYGETRIVEIRNVVQLPVQGCYFYRLSGDATMTWDDDKNPTSIFITPNNQGVWTRITVGSIRDTRPTRPKGCRT